MASETKKIEPDETTNYYYFDKFTILPESVE